MLDVGFSDPLHSELLDELRDVMEAGKHLGGQLFELRIHNGIQVFYSPVHCGCL